MASALLCGHIKLYNAQMATHTRSKLTQAGKVPDSLSGGSATVGEMPKRANPNRTKPSPRGSRPKKPDPARIAEIFRRLAEANPQPRGELEYVNPYTLLVAVVLSAQATDTGVNKATRPLFAIADTPEKMLALGEDKVREMIKTIGLFRTKAKNVILLSERLVKDFGSKVPQTREELETLPGVGRKTANVVMNSAFGAPTTAVDTHIFRISNRIPLAPGKNVLEVELGLEKIIPDEYKQNAHHWLILHGRYVCKARKPECGRCIIADLCQFKDKTI
jgi:endonuclease-3